MRALIILLLLGGTAAAHPLDTAYLRVTAHGGSLDITFDLDVSLAAQELRLDAGALEGVLASRAEELAGKLYRTRAPRSSEPCTWGQLAATRQGVTVTLRDRATCPPGDVRWDLSFGKRLAATFQILGKVTDAHGERVISIDKTTTELAIATSDELGFGAGVMRGLEATGLVPAGWAHGPPAALAVLLFVLVLLLGARGGTQLREVGAVIGGLLAGACLPGGAPLQLAWLAAIAVLAGCVATERLERPRWVLAALGGVLAGAAGRAPQAPLAHALGVALGVAIVLVLVGPLLARLPRTRLPRWVIPVASATVALAACVIAWPG